MDNVLPVGATLLALFDRIESTRSYARPELRRRRVERLIESPSGFFRGAPTLFYTLLGYHPDYPNVLGKEKRWIVGDVHMENIGVIAVGSGTLVFDFNDLDEAIVASPVLDVLRGAASAAIGASVLGLGNAAGLDASIALIEAYGRAGAQKTPRAVEALLQRARARTPHQLLDERCPRRHGVRRFAGHKGYIPVESKERATVEALFASYAEHDPIPWIDEPLTLEDCAFRIQGTGSLGVRRYVMLGREGKRGHALLIEAKEMRASALESAGVATHRAPAEGDAGRVRDAMRALLANVQVGVRALRGSDGRSYLVRLHAPGEDKLALSSLRNPGDFVALARMIGQRLGKAHQRTSQGPAVTMSTPRVLQVALDLASAMTRTHLALRERAIRGGRPARPRA